MVGDGEPVRLVPDVLEDEQRFGPPGDLEGLRLLGLMTVPPLTATAEEARPWFRRLAAIRDDLRTSHPQVQHLSMGMSLDYSVAVEEGATMVRIGTALFGPRTT